MTLLARAFEDAALRARRRVAVTLAVGLCAVAAAGFATAAAFLALVGTLGPTAAAAILAGFFAVAALAIALAFGGRGGRRRSRREAAELSDHEALAGLVGAFLSGFDAARQPVRGAVR